MRLFKLSIIILFSLSISEGMASGFSTHATNVSRSFSQTETVPGNPITVTITFSHSEVDDLRGFYFSEQIPEGLDVNRESLQLNGETILESEYTFEYGSSGDVYPGCIPYRWVLETPGEFSENHSISYEYEVKIVYSITSYESRFFVFEEFSWVGFFQDALDSAFGHSDPGDTVTIQFEDAPLNVAPTLTITSPSNNTSVSEDDNPIAFQASAFDPEDGNIGSNIQWSSDIDGAFSSPATLSTDTHTITASVTDNGGLTGTDSITLTVTLTQDVNHPPVLASIGDRTALEGEPLEFTITATDAEGDDLSYTASDLPTGASFNETTQVFSWTPNYGVSNTYNVLFSVTDDGTPPMSDSETVNIAVGDKPGPCFPCFIGALIKK